MPLISMSAPRNPGPSGKRRKNGSWITVDFIINLGEKQRVNVNRLMGIINDHVQNRHMRIGRVTGLPPDLLL
jgi:hypothetical protein